MRSPRSDSFLLALMLLATAGCGEPEDGSAESASRASCELLQGGGVVLDAGSEILGFRDASVPLVSASISSEGLKRVEHPEHRADGAVRSG